MDQIEIHFKESIQYQNLTIDWDFFVLEQAVEPDGSPGPHAVLIHLQLKSENKKSSWELTLPADYDEHFQKHPDQVTFTFHTHSLRITQADFNSFDRGFIRLEITTTEQQFLIDHKAVSEHEFKAFQKSLKEVDGTWFCAETTEGGATGYDMIDKKGRKYKFRAESKAKSSITSLTRLPE